LGIAESGGERLVDFVGKRGSDLSEDGGARGTLDFLAQLIDVQFRSAAADHMPGHAQSGGGVAVHL